MNTRAMLDYLNIRIYTMEITNAKNMEKGN